MARVLIKGLTKRFGDIVAVNDFNLEAVDKKLTVLLGPSGCGKTTVLRCIAGLERPDEGEIYIGDDLVNDVFARDRDVAMVFQGYALYTHMSVFDNLAFPLKIRKLPTTDIERRVKETAELLRIQDLLDRKPGHLSGGEAQRVAVGRAIIRAPSVFLMDEPLSNIDAKLRVYMRVELKRLQKELKTTTIYVTHDQAEAMTIADKIAVVDQGKLQQVGDPDAIYSSPAMAFIAGFIGSPPMNLMGCTLTEKDGKGFLDAGAFTYKISNKMREIIKAESTSSELMLGIRPEDITLHEKRIAERLIEWEIYDVEPLGSEVIVDLKLGEEIIKARAPPGFKRHAGDKVWVKFNNKKIHIFDKKTEKAII